MLRIQREKLTRVLNQIATAQENGETKKQGKTMERNLLITIALVVVCQAMGHTEAGWCASLVTLLAVGVQGQDESESWTLILEMTGKDVGVGEVVKFEVSGPQLNIQQVMTPTNKSWHKGKQLHKEEWIRSMVVRKKAELSLLVLTAAGVVCKLGGEHKWCGFGVILLTSLALGELWGHARAEDAPLHSQEHNLEAYDCMGLKIPKRIPFCMSVSK